MISAGVLLRVESSLSCGIDRCVPVAWFARLVWSTEVLGACNSVRVYTFMSRNVVKSSESWIDAVVSRVTSCRVETAISWLFS